MEDPSRIGEAARHAHLVFQVKGSVLRGRLHALQELGLIEKIVPHLAPATAQLVASPPPASAWIDGTMLAEIDDVVSDVLGELVLEKIAIMTVRQTVSPMLRSAVEGTLRLFGTSPLSLLARMDSLSGTTVRGVSFAWNEYSPQAGTMTVTYPTSTDVPLSAFMATRAGLVNVFEMCGSAGVIMISTRNERAPRNSARVECSW